MIRSAFAVALVLFFAASDARAQSSEPSDPPDEVTVRGKKAPTDPTAPKQSMEGREIRVIPGAFGDAFRALEALPGVTPIVSGLPYYFVRGAPPGNTGFFIDNVRVPGLYHLGVGPAVVYPALIDRVDLYKGAYPVSYGRFAGGIVAGETVGPADRGRADWTLRLFDAGALVEAPWGKHSENEAPPGTALVSGRYGYPGLLLSIFAPDAGLAYWDYQSRATYRLSEKDMLTVFALGSYDAVSSREEGEEDLSEVLNLQWHRIDLRWDRKLSRTGSMRTAMTLGFDRIGSEGFAARTFIIGSRTLVQEQLSKKVKIRGGADWWWNAYDFRLGAEEEQPEIEGVDNRFSRGLQSDLNLGAWVDAPLEVAPRLQITPGVRVDMYTSRGLGTAKAVPAVDPRVTTRARLVGPLTHIGAVGIAHQPAAIPLPLPALSFSQLARGLQGGYHMSQGLELALPWDLTASAAGYLHTYTGLVDLAAPCDGDDDPNCDAATTRGRSVGLELMLKRNLTKRIGGWVAYTLSRSTRSAYDPFRREYQSVLSQFDRTHVVNVIASFDLGKGWRAGSRYAGYSGIPYSTLFEQGIPNARTPFFHRIDVRLEKRWFPKGAANVGRSFAVTAEMFNVLLLKEPIGIECEPPPKGCTPEEIGPIAIPSLGFEGTL